MGNKAFVVRDENGRKIGSRHLVFPKTTVLKILPDADEASTEDEHLQFGEVCDARNGNAPSAEEVASAVEERDYEFLGRHGLTHLLDEAAEPQYLPLYEVMTRRMLDHLPESSLPEDETVPMCACGVVHAKKQECSRVDETHVSDKRQYKHVAMKRVLPQIWETMMNKEDMAAVE